MLSGRFLAAALGAAASLLAVPAAAQEAAPSPSPVEAAAPSSPAPSAATIPVPAWPRAPHQDDIVVMNDGGMGRGAIIEILPKDHVSVRLADGRTMIIPWDRVHHIEQGAPLAAPAAAPVVQTAPIAKPAASAPVTGSAHVHLDGGGKLERERAGQWIAVCSAPCDQTLDLDAFYRIGGDGVRNSKPFRLLAKNGDHLTLTADVSTTTAFGIGITLASISAVVGTVSYYGLVLASAQGTGYSRRNNDTAVGGFALAMLGSAGVGTAGLIMTVANEKSSVKQSVRGASSGTASASPAPKARASEPDRIPAWASMGSAAPEHRGAPIAMSVPLLGGRF